MVRLVAGVAVVAMALGITAMVAHRRDSHCQRSFVPAFFYPGPQWTQATGSSPPPAYLIFNVDSGPGTGQNPAFSAAAIRVRAAGVTILGYITTEYGHRPLADAEADVRAYRNLYGISSYFLDLTAPTNAELGYYRALVSYIRGLNPAASIWLNPGTYPAPQYMQLGTVVMVSETSYAGYQSVSVPAWAADYPADRFAISIYGTSKPQLTAVLGLARQRHVGYIFVTDRAGPPADPYGGLPSYWASETALAVGTCAS